MIAIAPTNKEWFNSLRSRQNKINDFNFWTPTPWNIKQLSKGDKFYFLLKSPFRKIGGYGQFKYYENLSINNAWNKFGKSNGVNDLKELIDKTSSYMKKNSKDQVLDNDYQIGCIVLENPIFFEDEEFIELEDVGLDFSKNIVKLKYFNEDINENKKDNKNKFILVSEENAEYTTSKSKKRKGQGKFRDLLMQAYEGACAITGENCFEVLEAAHIQPYINEDSNNVTNGILLRCDLHSLFDEGLITIDKNYKVILSNQLISNGYEKYQNTKIMLPKNKDNYPDSLAIEYHNKYIFRG